MASSINRMLWFFWELASLILFANVCHGFHFLGPYMYRHIFSPGDEIFAKVNPLTSLNTMLPFSYYSLPYCKPQGGIKQSEINIGQLLLGDQIMNSPYRFRMNVNETVFLCGIGPLTADEVKLLKQRIRDMYQVNVMLDYLPARRYSNSHGYKLQWIGFQIGYTTPHSDDVYIFNHIKFRILIHEHKGSDVRIVGTGEVGLGIITRMDPEYEIVGFEAFSFTVKHNPGDVSELNMYEKVQPIDCEMMLQNIIHENETVAFTYEVEFVKSEIKWHSRWDAYLEEGRGEIRRLSALSSAITIFILAVIVLVIYWWSLRRELTQYEEFNNQPKALPGWKLLVGDVFREPGCPKLLCVMVGDGVQITGMALAAIVLAALGLVEPVGEGKLLTSLIILYLLFSIAAGYAAVRLWGTIKGSSDGWKSVSWSVACFFPGIVFVVLTFFNVLLSGTKSTRVIPFALLFCLISLWFCISVPLTLVGGFLGSKAEPIQYPVRTNEVPREIPARKCFPWLLAVGAGILPFGTVFIELFLILESILFNRFYVEFGFLLVAFLSLVFVCALVSVIFTFTRLRAGDWCWWWKAFFVSGSAGLYVFLYSVSFLVFDLRGLNGSVSAAIYMGYSLVMVIAVMLATGTIGFLVSFYSVLHLYSSAKIDG